MNNISLRNIVKISIFAVLVFIFSNISIIIPLGIANTRIHIGNVLCVLSGLLIGKFFGGLAGGLGSFFYDLTNPIFVLSAPFTFCTKFILAYITGKSFEKNRNVILSSIYGCFTYVIIYTFQSFFSNILVGMNLNTNIIISLQKFAISSLNAILAIFASYILYKPLEKIIKISFRS